MAVTLIPSDVSTLTGVTVTAAAIATADQICDDETGYTFAEHNTSRAIPETVAQQAWALAAVNVNRWFTTAGDNNEVVAEGEGDYSYSVDTAERVRIGNSSPITGPVRRLLRLPLATWSHI